MNMKGERDKIGLWNKRGRKEKTRKRRQTYEGKKNKISEEFERG